MPEPLKRHPMANKRGKRLGCGAGSGKGGTCGRGNKGAGQRSGTEHGPKFEGGQMPLMRRLPKRGMQKGKKINHLHNTLARERRRCQIVNFTRLADWDPALEVNAENLAEKGLVRSASRPVKLLASGELKKPLNFTVHSVSRKAQEIIEKAGGKLEVRK